MNGYILTLSQEIRFGGILQEDNRADGTMGSGGGGASPPLTDFGRITACSITRPCYKYSLHPPQIFRPTTPDLAFADYPPSIFRPSTSSDGPIKNEFSRRACLVVL